MNSLDGPYQCLDPECAANPVVPQSGAPALGEQPGRSLGGSCSAQREQLCLKIRCCRTVLAHTVNRKHEAFDRVQEAYRRGASPQGSYVSSD
jgi:hypothetical protein